VVLRKTNQWQKRAPHKQAWRCSWYSTKRFNQSAQRHYEVVSWKKKTTSCINIFLSSYHFSLPHAFFIYFCGPQRPCCQVKSAGHSGRISMGDSSNIMKRHRCFSVFNYRTLNQGWSMCRYSAQPRYPNSDIEFEENKKRFLPLLVLFQEQRNGGVVCFLSHGILVHLKAPCDVQRCPLRLFPFGDRAEIIESR
jgi:hypothetical protein